MQTAGKVNVEIAFPNADKAFLSQLQKFERTASNFKLKTNPLGSITADFNKFNDSLEAANARVLAFSASAGGLYAVERAFSSLIKTTINVEKQLADVNVILGVSQKNLSNLSGSLFKIAKDTGQSFTQVVEAAKEFSRQGLGVEETLKRTRDALILTRLTGLDAKSAMEDLTAAVNTFSKAGLTTTQIINKFANVDAAFAVSAADLAEAIKRTGASASDAGVDIDELIALVASLQQTTARGGPVIGNALKSIFARLERPEILDQLQELGVKVREAGQSISAVKVLENLANQYDHLSEAGQNFINTQIGSLYQINQLKAGLQDLSKENSVYNQALDKARNATEQAITRNEELNKTLAAQLNALKNNLTQFGANFGESAINPALKGFASIGNTLLSGLNKNLDPTDTGNIIGKGIAEGIGHFLTGPGALLILGVVSKLGVRAATDIFKALQIVLGVKEQQILLEREIQAILAKNPEFIKLAQSSAQGELAVRLQILNTLKEQAALQAGLTSVSANITSSALSSGFGVDTKTKNIKIGRFANPLREAINREISSGISPSQVRIGASTQLVSNFNPLGLGVYNTVDEPGGLQQGISRARAEGRNPKTYGVPGFASKPIHLFDQIQQSHPDFYKNMADAVREGTENGWKKGLVSEMNKILGKVFGQQIMAGKTFYELNQSPNLGNQTKLLSDSQVILMGREMGNKIVTSLDRDPLANQIKGGISTVPIIPRNTGLNALLNPNFPFKTKDSLSGMPTISRTSELDNLLKSQYPTTLPFYSKTLLELQQKQNLSAGNPLKTASESKFFNSNAAIGLSLVTPILQGIFKNAIGNESLNARRVGGVADVLGSAASFGAAGGFLSGGPIGASFGAGLGLLMTLPDVIREWNSTLPELQKNLDSVSESINRTSEDLTQYITLNEKLTEIYTGKNNVSPTTLKNLEQQKNLFASRLQKNQPGLLKQLIDAEDGGGQNEIIAQFNAQQELKRRQQLSTLRLQTFIQNGKLIDDKDNILGYNSSNIPALVTGTGFGMASAGGINKSPIFGKKLDLDSQKDLIEFANFLSQSKTDSGNTLFELFSGSKGISEIFDINKEAFLKNPNNETANRLFNQFSYSFSGNKELTENLNILKNDTNTNRRNEGLKFLLNNLTFDKPGERSILEKPGFINLQNPSNIENIIRENSANLLRRDLSLGLTQSRRQNSLELFELRNQGLLDFNSNFISARQAVNDRFGFNRSLANRVSQANLANLGENFNSSINNIGIRNIDNFRSSFDKSLDPTLAKEIRNKRSEDATRFIEQLQSLGGNQTGLIDLLNSLNNQKTNYADLKRGGAVLASPEDLALQIQTISTILNDLTQTEIKYSNDKEKEQENLKQTLEKLNIELQKETSQLPENITKVGRSLRYFFSDEYASRRQGERIDNIRTGDYRVGSSLTESFFNEWEYRIEDLYKDLDMGASDLSKSIKGGFKDAISSIILDSKNAGEAFGNFGRLILSKIVNQSVDRTVDYVFSGIGSLASGFLKKSSGGPVTGGSGMKDDVPALLQGGEYVIKKSAVQQIGINRLNMLNNGGYLKKYASGGISGLSNTFDKGTGKFLIDPRLSDIALEDTNNPQNALRNILEDEYSRQQAYEYQKQKALRDFKSARKTAATFALISAGIQAAGAAYSSYSNSNKGGSGNISNPGRGEVGYSVGGGQMKMSDKLRFGYADGGPVFGGQSSKDNIPAMLMGGEYVIRKDVVDRYGKPYFDRLNRGVARFAEGGSVGLATTTVDKNNNSEKLIIALNLLSKNLENSTKSNSNNLENNSNINITINMTESGVTSENQIVVGNKKDKEEKNNSNKVGTENLKQLGQLIKSEVTKILVEEKRAGGLLSPIPR